MSVDTLTFHARLCPLDLTKGSATPQPGQNEVRGARWLRQQDK